MIASALFSEAWRLQMTAATSAPRIAPLQPPYEPDVEQMLVKWMPPNSGLEPLALFRTLTVHDDLSSRMRPLGAGILGHGRIEARERELIILRACARAGAEYEWGVHATAFGVSVGLNGAEIAATASASADDPVWSDADAQLIRAVDELHHTNTISDELWSELAERFSDDQLLEIIVAAGWYRLLSYVINAARIDLEPWAARFPAKP
jgi:alkylhydroperoxidase family enzyme